MYFYDLADNPRGNPFPTFLPSFHIGQRPRHPKRPLNPPTQRSRNLARSRTTTSHLPIPKIAPHFHHPRNPTRFTPKPNQKKITQTNCHQIHSRPRSSHDR